ncbi:hypothetical protein VTL71DRAFT_9448 [Oculimacula yallundae]|uniref:Uncharacterized protein n=1 Tax=Oculimacula yallundae TaxID=86028 RepID=A0ABR4BRX3_9HELO
MNLPRFLFALLGLLMSIGGLAGSPAGSGRNFHEQGMSRSDDGNKDMDENRESRLWGVEGDELGDTFMENSSNGSTIDGQRSMSLMWRDRVVRLVQADRAAANLSGPPQPKKTRKDQEKWVIPEHEKQDRSDWGALRPLITEQELANIRSGYGVTLPRLTAFKLNSKRAQPAELVMAQVSYMELFLLNYLREKQGFSNRQIYWPRESVTMDPTWMPASLDRDAELTRDLEIIRSGVRDQFWDIRNGMSGSGVHTRKSILAARKKAAHKNKKSDSDANHIAPQDHDEHHQDLLDAASHHHAWSSNHRGRGSHSPHVSRSVAGLPRSLVSSPETHRFRIMDAISQRFNMDPLHQSPSPDSEYHPPTSSRRRTFAEFETNELQRPQLSNRKASHNANHSSEALRFIPRNVSTRFLSFAAQTETELRRSDQTNANYPHDSPDFSEAPRQNSQNLSSSSTMSNFHSTLELGLTAANSPSDMSAFRREAPRLHNRLNVGAMFGSGNEAPTFRLPNVNLRSVSSSFELQSLPQRRLLNSTSRRMLSDTPHRSALTRNVPYHMPGSFMRRLPEESETSAEATSEKQTQELNDAPRRRRYEDSNRDTRE